MALSPEILESWERGIGDPRLLSGSETLKWALKELLVLMYFFNRYENLSFRGRSLPVKV